VLERFSTECHKTNVITPGLLLKPITAGTSDALNQLELKETTNSWRQTRGNVCEQISISFSLPSDWWGKVVREILTNQNAAKQNQSKRKLLSTLD